MITVYGMSSSGNCHKVRMALELLDRPYAWIETDSAAGQTRTPDFLARNPNGRVPIIEREDGSVLAESNAILCWLGEGTTLMPADAWERAQTMAWLFFEQYSHEPYVAVARFICGWTPADSPRRAELPRLRERAGEALAVMERHLQSYDWFGGQGLSIADLALFAYTHCADDGGISLAAFPQLRAWLQRMLALPQIEAMPSPPGLVATA
ncbi:glutathione S-transferase family protein [Pseudoxanthomonas sp.]|uniref:glutathione S-transferase family protein n=1 Tax=Pseudoxanthomonas sp. TaxID=1871049 RepID=UPI00260C251E|nr:glutathione S-transferase family protein [Pseudoxanthomonas sp.]WDS36700.1 MAG: glutathione S-transferase family protein [Pseudoxanthomonas sp.]